MISPEQFRLELSRRLNEVLPAGFKVHQIDDGVWLDAPDGFGTNAWTGHIERDPSDLALYLEAGLTVLNSLQDCVCQTLRVVWPAATTEPKHRMAMPGGKIEGTALHLWYGDEDRPVVRLRTIDLGV